MVNVMAKEEWFKLKRYPHLGNQISPKGYKDIVAKITNESFISKHSFAPFIHRIKKTKKYRKEYKDGVVQNKGLRKKTIKPRDLYYSTHIDSLIYSYYSHLLTKKYDIILQKENISNSVTAYRKIPKKSNSRSGKCNIDFANDIFDYIKQNSKINKNQVVIAFDIKGFFDNLNHKKLKEKWCAVINEITIPKHHYQFYKNITKFSYINENELFNHLNGELIIERYTDSSRLTKKYKKKNVKHLKYSKSQRVISFCNKKNDLYAVRKAGLIKSNKYIYNNGIKTDRKIGIPQGSPISATLANIYMLDFDIKMSKEISYLNGIYSRYSDDMVVVCDLKWKDDIINKLTKAIKSICDLEIQQKKTQIFHFVNNNNQLVCYQEFKNHSTLNRNLEYLGFQFDGENITIKNSSISAYYSKMSRSVNRSIYYARNTSNPKTKKKIFKSRLQRKFTCIGGKRILKRVRNPIDKSQFDATKSYNYGNYLTYVNKSTSVTNDRKIEKQLRNHWKILHLKLKK
jgi:hypothetical protein